MVRVRDLECAHGGFRADRGVFFDIAHDLDIAEGTVRDHMSATTCPRPWPRTGTGNRVGAVHTARGRGRL